MTDNREEISLDEAIEREIGIDLIELDYNRETGHSQFAALSEYGSEVLQICINAGANVIVVVSPEQRAAMKFMIDSGTLKIAYREGGSNEARMVEEDDNGNG